MGIQELNSEELIKRTLERAEKEQVRNISLQFTDVVGVVKNVTIPVERLEESVRFGVWFDGSSIEGFARIAESDMFLVPDLNTFAVIPWERGDETTARAICWVFGPGGEPFPGDPRGVLARGMEEARELGYIFNTGPELEFFLFKAEGEGFPATDPHDRAGYFDLSTDTGSDVRKQMVKTLRELGIVVEASHHEVAAGQHEIDFEYDTAVSSADKAVTLRYALKAIAHRNNLHATFMPKPIFGVAGNGMHVHQSLFTLDGNTAFADLKDEYGLSDIAKHFIAGQLHHARGMCAVLSPLVNSYKRLVPGYEAPVYISWARVNRSALIRVPRINPKRIKATRIELRCPDPSCNPYLAFAVMLKCGLDGIKKKMPLPEPVEENLYHFDEKELARRQIRVLPGSLEEALAELQKDTVVQEALGEHVYERFLEAKKQEWDAYRMYVSQWELDRYLEVF